MDMTGRTVVVTGAARGIGQTLSANGGWHIAAWALKETIMGPSETWRRALAEGRFLIQRSRADGTHVFPPRVAAPGSGLDDLEWVEASGSGTVISVTIIRPRPPAEPYNVVIVELDEGVRMMSRVEGLAPEAVSIGLRVRARIAAGDSEPILVFDPLHAEATRPRMASTSRAS
jgi:uncharacterized OB-fold protein